MMPQKKLSAIPHRLKEYHLKFTKHKQPPPLLSNHPNIAPQSNKILAQQLKPFTRCSFRAKLSFKTRSNFLITKMRMTQAASAPAIVVMIVASNFPKSKIVINKLSTRSTIQEQRHLRARLRRRIRQWQVKRAAAYRVQESCSA